MWPTWQRFWLSTSQYQIVPEFAEKQVLKIFAELTNINSVLTFENKLGYNQ